ncbi:MAG TPA: trigger factor, partial [Clostridiales bacterium]|nr:trigger factor [Clostridiales bacterium]
GNFIPGYEEQVAGHTLNETFDVKVSFPEDYHVKELAGKPAVFKTTIHKIQHIELPALDDDFAKDFTEFDTFDEYKKDVKAKIAKRHEDEADSAFESAVLDTLIEKVEAEIPEAMYVAETENFVRDYDNRLRMQGLDLKTYFQYTGLDLDKLRAQLRPQAEKQVKLRLALEKIAELEKLETTEEDINGEIKRIADAYQMKEEDVRKAVPLDSVAEDMKVKKAMDLVKEKAVIKK